MSHHIYREKFYSHRQPAWHGLGVVNDQPQTAVETAHRLGLPRIEREPVSVRGNIVPNYTAIVGIDLGGQETVYSIVTDQYHEITHHRFCHLVDLATGNTPIETLGLLGNGSRLFLTLKFDPISLRGDELQRYSVLVNDLTANGSNRCYTSHTRVVCQNTLTASLNTAQDSLVLQHRTDVVNRTVEWLKAHHQSQQADHEALETLYTQLMDMAMTESTITSTLDRVYPFPVHLGTTEPNRDHADYPRTEHNRDTIRALFEGHGYGSTAPTAQGTGWGLYNAVVEFEDYAKPRGTQASRAFGAGADRKQQAFRHLLTTV